MVESDLSFKIMHLFKTEVYYLSGLSFSFFFVSFLLIASFSSVFCLSLSYLLSFSVIMLPFSSLRLSSHVIVAFLSSHCCLSLSSILPFSLFFVFLFAPHCYFAFSSVFFSLLIAVAPSYFLSFLSPLCCLFLST